MIHRSATGFRAARQSARVCRGQLVETPVSDRSYFILAAGLLGAALLDGVLNGGGVVFFLLLKMADFVEYLAFWR